MGQWPGPQPRCALARPEPERWARLSLSLGPRGVNKSAFGALCGPNPSALGAHPARGPPRQSIFAQSTAGPHKTAQWESWEPGMLEACILKRDRERMAGDRERGRGRRGPPSAPLHPHHSARLSRAVNPGVRQKSPWGFVGPVTGSLCHPRAPCWIPYGQLGRGSARRDPHKTQIVSGFQTLYCCL